MRCTISPGWRPFLVRHEAVAARGKSTAQGIGRNGYRSRFCWGFPLGCARIAKLLGISPVELFKYPTIASLAKFVESMKVWKRIEFLTFFRYKFMNGQDTKPAKNAFVVSLPRMPQPSNGP